MTYSTMTKSITLLISVDIHICRSLSSTAAIIQNRNRDGAYEELDECVRLQQHL
jgi:hypothetical protein